MWSETQIYICRNNSVRSGINNSETATQQVIAEARSQALC